MGGSKGSVLVAMSGGVDSSVAACLLQEQGYDVVGSHMNLVHLDGVEHGCCGPRARADAAEVARIAGFPFEIVDLSEEFASTVIADFIAEHQAGRTPNPCARCNGEIKFGAFLRRADELGIDFVATGHYVRTTRDADGAWHLRRGDASKDQSYMLHMLAYGTTRARGGLTQLLGNRRRPHPLFPARQSRLCSESGLSECCYGALAAFVGPPLPGRTLRAAGGALPRCFSLL